MMKRLEIIMALCFLAGIVSCQKERHPREISISGSDGISFTASENGLNGWSPLAKSVNVDNSYLRTNGFGVYAYYTGGDNYTGEGDVKGVVLNNRKVSYGTDYYYNTSTGLWTNMGVSTWIYYGQNYYGAGQPGYKEYWPMKDGEKVTFFAYAPYDLWNSDVTPRGASCTGQVPSIPYKLFSTTSSATGADVSGDNATVTVKYTSNTSEANRGTFANSVQRDLLWGVRSTGYTYKNFTRPAVTTDEDVENTVDFKFRHALSKIGFKVLTEDVPSVSETAIYDFDTRAVLQSTGSQTGRYATNPYKTVFLLESIRIYSADGLLANSGTLSLDNTTSADQPEWSDVTGDITYVFDANNAIDGSILYVKDDNLSSNSSNNTENYSTLISRRTALTGLSDSPYNLMKSADNYFYALPASGNLTVEVKYHKLTFYYHYGSSYGDRYWTVYDKNDLSPLTRTFAANFEAGRRYDINLVLQGNEMELELEAQPWEMDNFTYEYTDADYSVIEFLTFDSDYMDYRIDDKVYINNRTGKFTFRVDGGRYLYWRASLIPNSAFAFTDKFGNYLTDTAGDLITMQAGTLDKTVSNEIYIKALNTSSTTLNSARLRFYFYDGEGHAVVPLNLINLRTASDEKILEWTVVQNAN